MVMTDFVLVERLGLKTDGHGLDPMVVLADARTWLQQNNGITILESYEAIPQNSLPSETWWGTYTIDNPSVPEDNGKQVAGVLQKGFPNTTPITFVSLPERYTIE